MMFWVWIVVAFVAGVVVGALAVLWLINFFSGYTDYDEPA